MRLWVRGAALSSFLFLLVGSGVPLCAQASLQRGTLTEPGVAAGLPQTGDRAAWLRWRQQMLARIPARQTGALSAKDATAAGGSGVIETIAGAVPFQTPITALQAGLGQLTGIAEDAHGNIFASTGNLGVVLKIDPTGNVSVYAGQPLASGPVGVSGDGGPATSAHLVEPLGLALDATGNLFVADREGLDVRRIDAATGIITTVAGTGTENGLGDGVLATSATVFPLSLAVDETGNLFLSEGESVREVNAANGTITTVIGSPDSTPPTSCDPSFSPTCPTQDVTYDGAGGGNGIAVRQGTLYVIREVGTPSDTGPGILAVNLSQGTTSLFAGGPAYYNDPNFYPTAVTTDSAGNVYYVSDLGAYKIAAGGVSHSRIAGSGMEGFSGDGGPATSANMINPDLLATGPSGNLLVGDDYRIRSVSSAGTIATVAGSGSPNFFGDGGAPQTAGLGLVQDIAADSQGDLYVLDALNNDVRKIDANSNTITTIAGNNSFFFPGQAVFSEGDGGPATQAIFFSPESLALDESGHRLYIGLEGQGIRVVDLQTGAISKLADMQVRGGMVFDGQHTLYVTAYVSTTAVANQVAAVDTVTGAITLAAGAGTFPAGNTDGDGGPATQAALGPAGLALDASGNLYIADTHFNFGASNIFAIRVVNLSTGVIQSLVSEQSTQPSSDGPQGIRYDGAGNILATYGSSDVRSIAIATGTVTPIAGTDVEGFSGDGGQATSALVNTPNAVAVDFGGNVLIADTVNDRIRRVVLHPTGLTSALAASATSVAAGTSVTFTATYSGLQYGYGPTGTVMFLDGTTAIGTGTVTAGSGGGYTATLMTAALNGGQHSITAQYSGDGNYAAGTTTAVALTVTGSLPQSYTVAANPGSLTIAQGASGTAAFTVTPVNGFNQAVSFSCGSGLGTGMSCSFSPASVTPTGTTAITSTLTVTTTGAGAAAVAPQSAPAKRWRLPGSSAVVAGLLLLGVPGRRRKIWLMVLLLAATVGLGAELGCGGSGSSGGSGGGGSGGGGSGSAATPAGAYTVMVNANAGSGSSALSQAVMFTVTVTQ